MKNSSQVLRRLLTTIIIAGGILLLGSIYGVSAQTLCGYGRSVGPCDGKEPSFPGSLNNDKGLQLGGNLSTCLMNGCSVLVGVIESIEIDQENRIAKTRFHVTESLSSNADTRSDELELHLTWSAKGDDTFFDVRLEPGSQLMVGKRPNIDYVSFALGNEKYFPSVRSTVLFNRDNDLREKFAPVLGPLKDQSDNIFAGYVSDHLWRLASSENSDEHLAVLETLLTDPNFPSQGAWSIGEDILLILTHENGGPSEASRDDAVRKLIEVACSNDSDRSITAIRVLTEISAKDWFQPRRYFDRSSAQKLIQSIHKIKGVPTAPLENKLSKID